VDYGDQHDVARFHEIYGNVTREEATFTEAAAAELKRLAEENAELRRQLAASSTKGGDA